MRKANPRLVGALLGLAISAVPAIGAGQERPPSEELPPVIQIDLHMVRVDRQIQSGDYAAALESLDAVLAIQAEHEMATPTELWFQHAQVALGADYPETAIASIIRYLQEAGRRGEYYDAALTLLDVAERRAQGAEVATPTQISPARPSPTRPTPTRPTPTPMPAVQPAEDRGGITLLFPLVGVNAANMAFTSGGPLSVNTSQLTGVAGGFAVSFPVGNGPFGVRLGAQWAQKGARIALADDNDVTANADIAFQTVDFTALARISPPAGTGLPLYGLLGPYVAFETDCRITIDASAGTERVSASNECGAANTQSLDFGVSGGLGFELGRGATSIAVGLLYNYGLQDIDSYTDEAARHRIFNVHVGVATKF